MKPSPALSLAALLLVALAGAATEARAQILLFQQTILPGVPARKLADAGDGTLLVTSHNTFRRYSGGWSLLMSRENYSPGVSGEPFVNTIGGLRLPDGRLLTFDPGGAPGGEWIGSRFVFFDDAGARLGEWPVPRGLTAMSTPELGSAGQVFHATNTNGVTTVRRWDAAGTITASWSLNTAACVLAVRNGVVYLAGDASGQIFKFNEGGVSLGSVPTVIGSSVQGMDVDASGRILAIAGSPGGVAVLSILAPSGTRLQALDRPGTGSSFSAPSDLVLVNNSTIYIADGSWGFGAVHQFSIQDAVPATAVSWGRMKALYR